MLHQLCRLFCAGSFFLIGATANAGLLIDPTGGTVLFDSTSNHDDQTIGRALGFTGHFFGTAETTVDVSTNGNLNFSGSTAYSNAAFPTTPGYIAPLWDDLYIYQGSGQSISEKVNPGVYYSATWHVSEYSNSAPFFVFQSTWFGAATTIGSFQFLPDDIVFSYSQVPADFRNGEATVGLNKGDGTNFSPVPGTTNGLITNAEANLLPTGQGQAVLFRPDGNGGYNASIIQINAAAPEPATVLSLATGALASLLLARRRRTRRETA